MYNLLVHRVLFLAVVFLFIVIEVPARDPSLQTTADEIREAMEARDFGRAEELVTALRVQNPAAFAANNYDYLLGRLAEQRGALAEATALYTAVLSRNSNLVQYALWRLSGIARVSGDLAVERQYIARLLASFPSSILYSRARERMSASLMESGDYRAVIPLLRQAASPISPRGRRALAALGEAYFKSGDATASRQAFSQLLSTGSRDDYSLEAALGLDSLDSKAGTAPDEFEAMRRARIYLANRHWSEARAHLLAIIERFVDSPNRAEALYQTGFSLYREGKFEEAAAWFQRAYAEFPTKRDGEEGYYWVGSALQKARRYIEAARRYEEFISAFPQSDRVESAHRNLIDCLRYAGKDDEAIVWSKRMESRYAGRPGAAVALFNQAKIELARNNYSSAVLLLTRLQAYPISPRLLGAPARGEVEFLRAYVTEQMGRLAEAVRLYLLIPADRENYFGHRATDRLRGIGETRQGRTIIESLAKDYRSQAVKASATGRHVEAKDATIRALRLDATGAADAELLSILRKSFSNLGPYNVHSSYRFVPAARPVIEKYAEPPRGSSHRELAAELIFLGLYDEGSPELQVTSSRGEAFSVAVHSSRGDWADVAIGYAEAYLRTLPQDYHLALLPRDVAELLYPAPYREILRRYSGSNGIDPRLVLAIARQESRFDPSAKSSASARGLLQFIPETAAKLAEEEGIPDFSLDSVYDPDTALKLATRYVGQLFKLFPDNTHAVIASYNAGEHNVERWLFRSRSNEVDRLVAEVVIPEAKDYLGKVMSNYQAYKVLYTSDLRPSPPNRLQ